MAFTFSFKRFWKGINIVPKSSSDSVNQGDIEVLSTDGRQYYHNGTTNSPVVTETHASQGANRLQSKDLDAGSVVVVDPSDTTKKYGWDISGATTGTKTTIVASQTVNRSVTLPDASDTLVGKATTDTLTNKTIDAANNTIENITDANISNSANISRVKIEVVPGAAYRILANDGSGAFSTNKALTNGQVVIVDSNGQLDNEAQLGINRGGTGQSTKANAFDALSPTTTKGDIAVRNSSTNTRLPIGSDGQVIVADSSQSNGLKWTTLQQGAKNYITYGNFENGATTGWSLQHSTLDSTSKLPNQASGSWTSASGTLSISTVSSGQLAGSYSLSYADSAATTAGDMLITDAYSLDLEDQAKVLSFRFYYKAPSGASSGNFSGTSSNSFGVAIYDVTNSSWIQPAGVYNLTQSSGVGLATGTFQTASNTASIRLAIYNVNATSGAITLYIDDVVVSPQIIPYGAPVTDWQSYTPTVTNFGSSPTVQAEYRRVGDSIESVIKVKLTNTASSTGLISIPTFLPSGLSLDTSKLPSGNSNQIVGSVYCFNDSTGVSYSGNCLWNTTSGLIAYGDSGLAQWTSSTSAGIPVNGSTSLHYIFFFRAPISGWSSSVQMSNNTDTRVVAMVARASGGTLTTTNQTSNFTWSNSVLDTHNQFSGGVYTVPVSGYYRVSGSAGGGASGTYGVELLIYKNGSATSPTFFGSANSADSTLASFDYIISCNAGDTLALGGKVTTGSQAVSTSTILNISRLSGPSTIAANETVTARYNTSTSSIANNSQTTMVCTAKNWDSHGAYDTGTGKFTAPITGKYRVSASAEFSAESWTATAHTSVEIYKNGSRFSSMASIYVETTASEPHIIFGSDSVDLLAGEYLEVRIYQNQGTSKSLSGSSVTNWITIEKVGN